MLVFVFSLMALHGALYHFHFNSLALHFKSLIYLFHFLNLTDLICTSVRKHLQILMCWVLILNKKIILNFSPDSNWDNDDNRGFEQVCNTPDIGAPYCGEKKTKTNTNTNTKTMISALPIVVREELIHHFFDLKWTLNANS